MSVWTVSEWETFRLREDVTGQNLVFPVLAFGDTAHYPGWVLRRQWFDLTSYFGGGLRKKGMLESIEINRKISDLASYPGRQIVEVPPYEETWPKILPREVEKLVVR